MLVSLTTSVTLSRISFTSAQIASRVEEASAEATFYLIGFSSLAMTPYTIAAEPKLRIAPYIIRVAVLSVFAIFL